METLHVIIDATIEIMETNLELCGYNVTLMNVAIWSAVAFFVLWIFCSGME